MEGEINYDGRKSYEGIGVMLVGHLAWVNHLNIESSIKDKLSQVPSSEKGYNHIHENGQRDSDRREGQEESGYFQKAEFLSFTGKIREDRTREGKRPAEVSFSKLEKE